MRIAIITFALSAVLYAQTPADTRAATIPSALAWFSVWQSTESGRAKTQECKGQVKGTRYSVRCDPLGVIFGGDTDGTGHCSVLSMRPVVAPDDLAYVPTGGIGAYHPPDPTVTPVPLVLLVGPPSPPPIGDCPELGKGDAMVHFKMPPAIRGFSTELTATVARVAAATGLGPASGCILRYPKVRAGDPLADVYEVCAGVVKYVYEFRITGGKVADYPFWTYMIEKKDLPAGSEKRLANPELWSGTSNSQ